MIERDSTGVATSGPLVAAELDRQSIELGIRLTIAYELEAQRRLEKERGN